MSGETRVGYATIDALFDMTEAYIKAHSVDKKYIGKPEYPIMAYELREYLKEEKEDET